MQTKTVFPKTISPKTISPKTYARLTLASLITLSVIIVTGAAVRVTGSGLGCPNWPTCAKGDYLPLLELRPMIEFANRMFTFVCCVAVAIAVLGSFARRPYRRDLMWLSVSLVLGVIAQAVLGGVSVLVKLDPPFVMAHFLLSMVIAWAAFVLVHRARQPDSQPRLVVPRDVYFLVRALGVLGAIVIFIGTMVTGTGRHGGDLGAERLSFNIHTITKAHGAAVWIFLIVVFVTLWRMQVHRVERPIRFKAELLMLAIYLQGGLGYLQYALKVPAPLVLLHVLGSVLVLFALLNLNLAMHERYENFGVPVVDDDRAPLTSLD